MIVIQLFRGVNKIFVKKGEVLIYGDFVFVQYCFVYFFICFDFLFFEVFFDYFEVREYVVFSSWFNGFDFYRG